MKKEMLGILVALSSLSFISAETVVEKLWTNTLSFIRAAFESTNMTPDNTSKILLGILLYLVVYSVLVQIFKTSKNSGRFVGALTALIIVLLAFWGLPPDFIESIIAQYGAMGAALLSIIPFLIILYFSLAVTQSLFIARVTWIFYVLYYIGILTYKITTLSASSPKSAWIPYAGAIIAGFIVFAFLPGIRGLIFEGKLDELKEKGTQAAKRREVLTTLEKTHLESFK